MLKTRRDFILQTAAMGLLSFLPSFFKVWPAISSPKKSKTLWLHNTHTGETLKRTYWEKGKYISSVLSEFNRFLRDHRSGEICKIDVHLFDLLTSLQTLLNYHKPFDVISGYRSIKTNNALRKKSAGVARNSYHTKGQAIDVRFRDVTLSKAKDAALSLKKGGVGFYPRSGFIHVDVRGYPRYWRGC